MVKCVFIALINMMTNECYTTNSELLGALWIMAEESHYVVTTQYSV